MAINWPIRFPGMSNAADNDYPAGSAKNVVTEGDGTGTPWVAEIVNDFLGFFQSLLSEGGLTADNTLDTVGDSQYMDGLREFVRNEIGTGSSSVGNYSPPLEIGTRLNIPGSGTQLQFTRLTDSRFTIVEPGNNTLRTIELDTAGLTTVGSTLSLPDAAGLTRQHTALSSTRIAIVGGNAVSGITAYDFSGTAWTQTGNAFSPSPSFAGSPAVTALTSTDIAVFSVASSTGTLQAYRFDGTDWTALGNALTITTASGVSSLGTMSSTDVALLQTVSTGTDHLARYTFDGTDWTLVGTALDPTLTGTSARLAALGGNDVIVFDLSASSTVRIYRFSGTTWSPLSDAFPLPDTVSASGIAAISGTDFVINVASGSPGSAVFRFGTYLGGGPVTGG